MSGKSHTKSKIWAAIILMRIPFSVYLMPVFWFSLTQVPSPDATRAAAIFIILHLFVYPASNGYNSYFDKDEGSIGGLKHPPPVNPYLFYLVVLFDMVAIGLSYLLHPLFAAMIGLYVLVSKAYSYDRIRLKRFPITSAIVVTFFQGAFTYLSVQIGMHMPIQEMLAHKNLLLAAVSTVLLAGSYPLTQIYQHEEDKSRGDITLSIMLGVWGTFIFSGIALVLGSGVLAALYLSNDGWNHLLIFVISSCPVIIYFTYWIYKVRENLHAVNYEYTMRMNQIASLALSTAFIIMLVFTKPI